MAHGTNPRVPSARLCWSVPTARSRPALLATCREVRRRVCYCRTRLKSGCRCDCIRDASVTQGDGGQAGEQRVLYGHSACAGGCDAPCHWRGLRQRLRTNAIHPKRRRQALVVRALLPLPEPWIGRRGGAGGGETGSRRQMASRCARISATLRSNVASFASTEPSCILTVNAHVKYSACCITRVDVAGALDKIDRVETLGPRF